MAQHMGSRVNETKSISVETVKQSAIQLAIFYQDKKKEYRQNFILRIKF